MLSPLLGNLSKRRVSVTRMGAWQSTPSNHGTQSIVNSTPVSPYRPRPLPSYSPMATTTAHPSRYQSSASSNSSANINPNHPPGSASVLPSPFLPPHTMFEEYIVDMDETWVQDLRRHHADVYKVQAETMHKEFIDQLAQQGPEIGSDRHNELFQNYQNNIKEMKKLLEEELDNVIDIERKTRLWSLGQESNLKALQEEQASIYENIRAEIDRAQHKLYGEQHPGRGKGMYEQVAEVQDVEREATATDAAWQKTEQQRLLDRAKWQANARANAAVRERRMHDETVFAAQEARERIRAEQSTQIEENARIGKEALRGATSSGGAGIAGNSRSTAMPQFWDPNQPSPPNSQSSASTYTARPAQRSTGNANTSTSFGASANAKSGGGVQSDEPPKVWVPPGMPQPPSRKPSMQFESSSRPSAGPARKPSMQFESSSRPSAGPARKPSMQFESAKTGPSGPARKSSMLFGLSPSPVINSIPTSIPEESPSAANGTSNASDIRPHPLPTGPPLNFPPRQSPSTSSMPPRHTPSMSLPPRQNTFPSYPTSSPSSTSTKSEPTKPSQPTRSFSTSFAPTDATPRPQQPSMHANGGIPRSASSAYPNTATGSGGYSSASGAGAGAGSYSSASASFSSASGAVPPFSSANGNGTGPYTATNKNKYGAAPNPAKTTTSTSSTAGLNSSTSSASGSQGQAQGLRESFSTVNDEARAQKRNEYQSEQQRLAEAEAKRRENEINEKRAEEARRRGEERRRQEELAREAQRREAERKARAARAASGQPNPAPRIEEPVIEVWNAYEQQWSAMANASHLRFRSIPWPIMAKVDDPEQLIPVQIAHFILNPQHSTSKSRKDRLKEALLRWHPDRFETKWLKKVVEEDREAVKDGVGRVVRALNDLLNPTDLFG